MRRAFSGWVDAGLETVADPDARALLAALRGLPRKEWPEPGEAPRVVDLADTTRTTLELRRRIGAAEGAPAWARSLRPVLEARHLGIARENDVRARAVRELGEALAARGLDAVAFKGLHLAHAVYADPADRPFSDVDLLVRPGDRAPIEDALATLGFVPGKAQTGEGAIEASFLRELRPGLTLDVDLHWRLVGPHSLVREMRPDDAGVIARSTLEWPGIRFPSPEDALVLAAINLVRHGFRPLGNILDLRELARKVEPAQALVRARESGTRVALSVGLALATELFGAEVAEDLARGLEIPAWEAAIFRRVLPARDLVRTELGQAPLARYALKILAQDGVGPVRTVLALPGVVRRRG